MGKPRRCNIEPDALQHVGGAFVRLFLARILMNEDRFGHLIADGLDWIERGHRFLKYHAHGVAAHFAQVGFQRGQDIGSIEQDLP